MDETPTIQWLPRMTEAGMGWALVWGCRRCRRILTMAEIVVLKTRVLAKLLCPFCGEIRREDIELPEDEPIDVELPHCQP